jgi:hypothetical protein
MPRQMTSQWQPYREPLRKTMLRTGLIAVTGGAVVARLWGGSSRWLIAVVLMLWPSFGGHWVEVFFLNWLRPHLSVARGVQTAARLGIWFVGGVLLTMCMGLTAIMLVGFTPRPWPAWWLGGLAFIAVELVAHLALQLRGLPNFYNGRG